jgi:hypothetical protein
MRDAWLRGLLAAAAPPGRRPDNRLGVVRSAGRLSRRRAYERRPLLGSSLAADERDGTWGSASPRGVPDASDRTPMARSSPSRARRLAIAAPAAASSLAPAGPSRSWSASMTGSGARSCWSPGRGPRTPAGKPTSHRSRAAPGDCAAGGAFSDGKLAHAFVVTAQNGTGAGRGPSPAREQGCRRALAKRPPAPRIAMLPVPSPGRHCAYSTGRASWPPATPATAPPPASMTVTRAGRVIVLERRHGVQAQQALNPARSAAAVLHAVSAQTGGSSAALRNR